LYSFLDTEYINSSKVTKENLLEKLGKYNNGDVIIDSMYVSESSETISTYLIYGYLKETSNISDFYLMITTDTTNNTFEISPYEYIVKLGYDKLNVGDKIERDIEEITNKKYNKYSYSNVSDEDIILDYINQYKTMAIYNTEKAYNLLDKEYREKRFGSLENYKRYVQENKNSINTLKFTEFASKIRENYNQYTCINNSGDYYTFRVKSINSYVLILDNYTVDLPELVESYNKATTKQKSALNIQKIVDSINNKDYNYSYSKLSQEFKKSNFTTLQSYENYIKQNFYEKNEAKYGAFEETNNGINTYKITLTDSNDETKQISKTVIVKLEEGTGFMWSFNK
jgi:hypothetical protein